jgi:hypothetical protein
MIGSLLGAFYQRFSFFYPFCKILILTVSKNLNFNGFQKFKFKAVFETKNLNLKSSLNFSINYEHPQHHQNRS